MSKELQAMVQEAICNFYECNDVLLEFLLSDERWCAVDIAYKLLTTPVRVRKEGRKAERKAGQPLIPASKFPFCLTSRALGTILVDS